MINKRLRRWIRRREGLKRKKGSISRGTKCRGNRVWDRPAVYFDDGLWLIHIKRRGKIGGRKGCWGHSVFSFDEGWKKRRFGKVIGDYEQKWGMTGSFHVKMKGIWMSWEFAWFHKFLEQHQGGWEQVQWTWDPCDRRMEAQENQNLRKTVTKLLWEMEVENRRAAEDSISSCRGHSGSWALE